MSFYFVLQSCMSFIEMIALLGGGESGPSMNSINISQQKELKRQRGMHSQKAIDWGALSNTLQAIKFEGKWLLSGIWSVHIYWNGWNTSQTWWVFRGRYFESYSINCDILYTLRHPLSGNVCLLLNFTCLWVRYIFKCCW